MCDLVFTDSNGTAQGPINNPDVTAYGEVSIAKNTVERDGNMWGDNQSGSSPVRPSDDMFNLLKASEELNSIPAADQVTLKWNDPMNDPANWVIVLTVND